MAKEKIVAAPKEENVTKTTLSELQQSVYTADEFARMHKKFNTTADIVKVALKMAGKDRCSYAEAEKIIKKFLSK